MLLPLVWDWWTALTPGASGLLSGSDQVTMGLALRIGAAAFASAAFAFFVAKYAELHGALIHAGRKLTLRPDQRLQRTDRVVSPRPGAERDHDRVHGKLLWGGTPVARGRDYSPGRRGSRWRSWVVLVSASRACSTVMGFCGRAL